eukprot:707868-Pelagomonas_calceolata.AAC.6
MLIQVAKIQAGYSPVANAQNAHTPHTEKYSKTSDTSNPNSSCEWLSYHFDTQSLHLAYTQ